MKKTWVIILAIINLLGFCILGLVSYVVIFRLIKGYSDYPVFYLYPIGALIVLISEIMTIKRRSWRWGIVGLFFVVVGVLLQSLYFWVLSRGF